MIYVDQNYFCSKKVLVVFVRRHSVHFHFTFMHITINMNNAFNLNKFIKLQLFLFEHGFFVPGLDEDLSYSTMLG